MARRVPALLLAIACCGGLWLVRAELHRSRGLFAEYFANPQWTAPAAVSDFDDNISTDRMDARWAGAPPAIFSVRWAGYLAVGTSGSYRFSTTSDDGSLLYVDNQLIVDNGGLHGAETREGRVDLQAGSHLIVLEYEQRGGLHSLEWEWAKGDGRLGGIPSWMLSHTRVPYRTAWLGHAVDWAWTATLIVAALLAILILTSAGETRAFGAVARYPRAACLGLFILLTVAETWPLAAHPGQFSRNDNADTVLNEWVLAWIAHEAPRAPTHVFDANIFYPERRTLAYSEAMLVQGAIAAPLLWTGASPVLAYNLVLLSGFVLTGWAMCLVIARWTGDWAAGITAGILAAFNAHNLTRLPHLQTQHVEFFPLALLALDTLIREPRVRHAVWLAIWFSLQALTSYYLLVITGAALVASIAVRDDAWRRGRVASVAPYIALAAGVAAAVLVPYLWPYWRVHQEQGFSRSLQQVLPADWRDYLTTPARVDHGILERWSWNNGLFPGFIATALAVVAAAAGAAFTDRRARMCLALGVSGLLLSFGTAVPGYAILYRLLPPLAGIRAVSRFGYLPIVAIAMLAGFGVARLRQRIGPTRLAAAIALCVPLLAVAETWAAPIRYTRFPGIPHVYRMLQRDPAALVVELPFWSTRAIQFNAAFMLNTTGTFNPMLNGYSGFIPASYGEHYDALRTFPDPSAIRALQQYGVRYVFVRLDQFNRADVERIERVPELRPIAIEDPIAVYRVSGR